MILTFLILWWAGTELNFLMAQQQEIRVRTIHLHDGLPNPNVLSILQDQKGFMWLSTFSGIARYDGYQMKTYNLDYGQLDTLPKRDRVHLFEDSKGRIWAGTAYNTCKLFIYRPDLDQFLPAFFDTRTGKNLYPFPEKEWVSTLFEDSWGRLIMGTWGHGLFVFELKDDSLEIDTVFQIGSNKHPEPLPHPDISGSISVDLEGNLWIPTGNGLVKWEIEKNRFITFKVGTIDLQENYLFGTFFEPPHTLWVGSLNEGLIKFNIKTEAWTQYTHDPQDPFSLHTNRVYEILRGPDGKLWLRTDKNFSQFDDRTGNFTFLYSKDRTRIDSYDFNIDRSGNLWIGGWGKGANIFNPLQNRFDFIFPRHQNGDPAQYRIISFEIDSYNRLWVVTEFNGIFIFDLETLEQIGHIEGKKNRFGKTGFIIEFSPGIMIIGSNIKGSFAFISYQDKKFKVEPLPIKDFHEIRSDFVNGYCTWVVDELWLSAIGYGIFQLDPKQPGEILRSFTKYDGLENFSYPDILKIFRDRNHDLWISGNQSGLRKWDSKTKQFERYITNYGIHDIFQDSTGILWLGTHSLGILGFNPETGKIIHLPKKIKEKIGVTRNFQADKNGRLWLHTPTGIAEFDPYSRRILRHYGHTNWEDESNIWYTYQSNPKLLRDGKIAFGSNYGILIFHPDSLTTDQLPPQVAITDFRISNQSLHPGPESPLKAEVSYVQNIVLPYDQNDVSIAFAALHFKNEKEYQYRFQMAGLSDKWENIGARNTVYFGQLEPGRYTFWVQAANSDGYWNKDGAKLNITIRPPWWNTWYAWAVYVLLSAITVVVIFLFILRQRIDRERAENLAEIDKLKNQFFVNISHEFRHPLTLILGHAEQIEKEDKGQFTFRAEGIKRNGQRLLNMINQLLDLAKLETGFMTLKSENLNLVPHLKNWFYAFEHLAMAKGINLQFECQEPQVFITFDPEKMERVIFNLISNAVKFSPNGGTITMKMENLGGRIDISIKDQGPGIPDKEQGNIFDRFYQTSQNKSNGVGIGLALARELVQLHGGEIALQSQVGKGSTFTVSLPIKKTTEILPVSPPFHNQLNPSKTLESQTKSKEGKPNVDHKQILIAEDNAELLALLSEQVTGFGHGARVAQNGREALETAQGEIPDLIISDMMMPEMDGLELLKCLRADIRTSHIPFIMLTASAAERNRLKAFKIGSDAYLEKPYSALELEARIQQIFTRQDALIKSIMDNGWGVHLESIHVSKERQFIQDVIETIEKNLSNDAFSVELLAEQVNLSTHQLNRKLKALIGKPPGALILQIRMESAKRLLKQKAGNISEIGFLVGYGDPAHFSRAFKRYFGNPPSDYLS